VREPEFLPRWYPQLLRRRRVLAAQAWSTAAFCAALAAWAMIGMHRTDVAQKSLTEVQGQLVQTGVDLKHLAMLSETRRELERQDEIVRGLGVDVPVTRIFAALDQLMPQLMAMEDLHLQTEEVVTPQTDAQRATGKPAKVNRKLLISLTGVAPTQDDLATFLDKLVAVPYFGEVALVKSHEESENFHLVLRFQVQFAVSLDVDAIRPPSVATSAGDMP
jgi:hypothetical protein